MARLFLCVLLFAVLAPRASAYSVLTHEAIIDTAWETHIKPLLLKRFPNSTPDELIAAHGYAYGGCIIQDMGYYPFGSKLFSDLTHYVRSGDFVVNMLGISGNLTEYAFALGALAHYAADTEGHSIAVNRAVPMEYPKLKRKYGAVVTYADDAASHIKTEFGFDVLQVALGDYAPKAYHDFIGFEVSRPVLERAFALTYSLKIDDVFGNLDVALGTYRHTVSSIIPKMTKVAWNLKKDELVQARPGLTRRKFLFNLSRASYEKEWGHEYERPGVVSRVLAILFRLIPKVGPLRALAFKPPTSATARLFEESFNRTLDVYRKLLGDTAHGSLRLVNRDFDTGKLTAPGEYPLADKTYARLVRKIAEGDPSAVDAKLRSNILGFYQDPDARIGTKRDRKEWRKTQAALAKLRGPVASGSGALVAVPR